MEWQCVGCGAQDCNCELNPAQEQAILDQRAEQRWRVRYTFTVTVEGVENATTTELYQGAKLMLRKVPGVTDVELTAETFLGR